MVFTQEEGDRGGAAGESLSRMVDFVNCGTESVAGRASEPYLAPFRRGNSTARTRGEIEMVVPGHEDAGTYPDLNLHESS